MGPSPYRKGGLARVKHSLPAPYGAKGAPGWHAYTHSEYERVASDPYYRELDSAGETRIVPRKCQVRLDSGTILHVLRVRVRPPDLYYRHQRGWVLALNTANGQEVYIQERFLEPVE